MPPPLQVGQSQGRGGHVTLRLRTGDARKFGILSAMSLMTATALVGADKVVNSFVAVEGDLTVRGYVEPKGL